MATDIEEIMASGPKNGTVVVTIQQLDVDFDAVGQLVSAKQFALQTGRSFNSRHPNTQLGLILAIQRFRILNGEPAAGSVDFERPARVLQHVIEFIVTSLL